eukprot:SAG11_NODE_645_length_7983_cov_5.727596_3_plen_86_part_00
MELSTIFPMSRIWVTLQPPACCTPADTMPCCQTQLRKDSPNTGDDLNPVLKEGSGLRFLRQAGTLAVDRGANEDQFGRAEGKEED